MRRTIICVAVAAGMLAGNWAPAVASEPVDSYSKVEASALVRSPQNSWAKAILFTDVLVAPPDGRSKRLDRRDYREMRLKTVGSVWVPSNLAEKFKALQVGSTYSFAGTVDQISRRYYIIVDACYMLQTAENLKEHWTDMLNPPATPSAGDVSATAMQTLLVEAQNSLIKLARENNTTVAQLIEMQTDGGQRIAANIVADALAGELRAQNQTAEELMISAVLALLQKQAVMEESARVGEERAASAKAAAPEESAEPVMLEPTEAMEIATPEAALPESVVEATPGAKPEAEELEPDLMAEVPVAEVPAAVAVEEGEEIPETEWAMPEPVAEVPMLEPEPGMTEAAPVDAPAEMVDDLLAGLIEEEAFPPELEAEEEIVPETMAETPMEAVAEEIPELAEVAESADAGELAVAEEWMPGPAEDVEMPMPGEMPEVEEPVAEIQMEEPEAVPSSSRAVVPLTRERPEITPMVSVRPTKAELAQRKQQDALAQRQAERAAKQAMAADAARKRDEARLAAIQAKRMAAAEKKAAAEARQADAAKAKAEAAERLKSETARRQEAAAKAKAEAAARKEAEAKETAQQASNAKARREAEAAARAAEKATTEPAKTIESGELPEWMQPVVF